MSFTIQQPKDKSVHFLNNSLDNLVRNLGENDFYHLCQEFDANVLDLCKKKGFFLLDYCDSLKNSKTYLEKINFIIY